MPISSPRTGARRILNQFEGVELVEGDFARFLNDGLKKWGSLQNVGQASQAEGSDLTRRETAGAFAHRLPPLKQAAQSVTRRGSCRLHSLALRAGLPQPQVFRQGGSTY